MNIMAKLCAQLGKCGLHANFKKNKIFISECTDQLRFMNVQDDFVEILNCDTSHKYFGKNARANF
jgi:hypothetical protein